MTSSVAKINLVVAEMTFKVAEIKVFQNGHQTLSSLLNSDHDVPYRGGGGLYLGLPIYLFIENVNDSSRIYMYCKNMIILLCLTR